MRTWRLLLIGFGNVGQGTAARLRDSSAELARAGCAARIVGVIDPIHGNVAREEGLDPATLLELVEAGTGLEHYPESSTPADALAAIAQVPADVVFEMTPTELRSGGVGLQHVRRALRQGLHVCTTNKGPVALAWGPLQELAAENGVQLRCEGTVMSGTPVLNLHEHGLAGAGVRGVRGILNGTCNFMISEMEDGRTYDEALLEAQRRGYAETDPSGDVDGLDAAAKVAILANLVLGVGAPGVARRRRSAGGCPRRGQHAGIRDRRPGRRHGHRPRRRPRSHRARAGGRPAGDPSGCRMRR